MEISLPAEADRLEDLETLQQLLAPMAPEVFVNQYWDRKPLFLKGHPDKFAELFDIDRFVDAVGLQHEVGMLS
jgi:ribosomal protein L16 Arg81 hydroxylase